MPLGLFNILNKIQILFSFQNPVWVQGENISDTFKDIKYLFLVTKIPQSDLKLIKIYLSVCWKKS